jgi:peptide/nickel transport system substrate-binding protein
LKSKWNLAKLNLFVIALVVIISLLTIGCSSKATTSTTTTSKPATTTANPTTTAVTTTAKPATTTAAVTTTTAAIKKGGTLKIICSTSPNAFGYPVDELNYDDSIAASPCLETLFVPDSSGAAQPWLATGLQGDPNTNTVLITLRQGVQFQDGTPFNAAAVKWNLDAQLAISRTEMKFIKSIDRVDDYRILIHLTSYDSRLADNFCSYPGQMCSPTYFKSVGEDAAKLHPVGTGPFKFVSFKRDVNLKYTRWEGYWQTGKPNLDNLEFDYIADPMVRMASFQAGDGDVLLGIEAKDAKTLEATGKYVTSAGLGTLWGLAGDGSHSTSPFADIKVRQAIEYAVNRDPVVKTIGLGYWTSTDQPCSKTSWGYNTQPSPFTFDPAKAKALLTSAGYPNGLGGIPLICKNQPATCVDFYTAILEQLNNAGFGLKLNIVDPGKFADYVIKTGWTNTLLMWDFGEGPDASTILTVGFSSLGYPYRSPLYPQEIDDIVKQIIPATDFNTKKALTQKANGLMRDKYTNVTTLCSLPNITVTAKYVQNIGNYGAQPLSATFADGWLNK